MPLASTYYCVTCRDFTSFRPGGISTEDGQVRLGVSCGVCRSEPADKVSGEEEIAAYRDACARRRQRLVAFLGAVAGALELPGVRAAWADDLEAAERNHGNCPTPADAQRQAAARERQQRKHAKRLENKAKSAAGRAKQC